MKLTNMKFIEFDGQPNEWRLERCTLEDVNLIVGNNASGKSRILAIINSLANSLSRQEKLQYPSGDYEVFFEKDGEEIKYYLKYENQKVLKEKLLIAGNTLMDRGSDGTGKIYSDEFKKNMKFQAPVEEVAAFSKMDSIQHPFLDKLFNWSDNLIRFLFGTPLGQNTLVSFVKRTEEDQLDLKNTNEVISIFKKGRDKYSDEYISLIISDMAFIGYEIEEIDIGSPFSIHVVGALPAPPMCIRVKERDLNGFTDQNGMSQGMFRALSLIIQLNYASLAQIPTCVLIDDIGEGLDFERSTNLIKLIIDKAEKSSTQLIMATNDRFVMNNVPLQYWTIIHRVGNRVICLNNRNSPKLFDDFAMTGLNNFDLFSSNYFLKYLEELEKD